MENKSSNNHGDFEFTEIGRLRHENKFLQDRVNNLEAFKANFFMINKELTKARHRLDELEQQLNLQTIKNKIINIKEKHGDDSDRQVETIHNILEFMQHGLAASAYEDLAAYVFQSTDGADLEVTVQFRLVNEILNFSMNPVTGKDNVALINKHRSSGEVVENQKNIVINQRYISLAVNNLPDEAVKRDLLKDYLIILAISTNAYVGSMSRELELRELRKNIYKVFRKTHESFEAVRDNIDKQVIDVSELYIEFERKLIDSLTAMNLSEKEIQLLRGLIYEARSELNLLLTSSLTIDEQFLAAIIKLEKAYAQDYSDDK